MHWFLPTGFEEAALLMPTEQSRDMAASSCHAAVLTSCADADTRELSAWQQRFVTAQRLAAAGHRHLCQMAADTMYRSTVRQFVMPVGLVAPGAAQAVYEAGRQLGSQQQQALAALPPSAVPMQPDLQLLLQVVSIDSSLQDSQLQLQVCVEPSLQCMLPHEQGVNMPAWRGALLQLCHAELLLWHAGTAGVTVRSSWSWDPVAGQLMITATTGFDTLLQLHSIHSTDLDQAHAGTSSASREHSVHGGKASNAVHGQLEVAQALAAAVRRLTGSVLGCSSSMGSCCQSGTLQLQAAIAVSACYSTQAVVQWESSCQQQQLTAGQRLLQRTQLLSPAVALLHLQPVRVSVQDILLQKVAAQTPGLMLAPLPAAADLTMTVAARAGAPMQADSHDAMQTPVKASAAGHVMGDSAGLPDVVPATPCSVIPDSQEDEELHSHGPHERQQQLQQWWQSQRQPAALSAPGSQAGHGVADVSSPGKDGNSRQGAASDVQATAAPAGQHVKLLLVQSSSAGLQLLPSILQRMQCFQAVHSQAAGSSSLCQQFVLKAAGQHPVGPQQQLSAADLSTGSSSDAMLNLVPVDVHSILVKLAAPAVPLLGTLHQLLGLALRQMPEVSLQQRLRSSRLETCSQQ
jgi:hypothetical protein